MKFTWLQTLLITRYTLLDKHECSKLIYFGSFHLFCLKYSFQACDECGEDFCLYNTNVMYDRYGRYVAKYHKYNLFNSEFPLFNIDKNEQNIYVDTDFGKLPLHV